jgi:hypothetical protein
MRNAWKGFAAALAVILVLGCCPLLGGAAPLIVANNSAFGGGPIQTFDFSSGATVGSFVPTGASDSNNGRGVLVIGDEVFYTELTNEFGPTDFIRVAPFNGGAGGADTRTLPNPRPGTGIADLAVSGGVLYALTGYPNQPLRVFGLNPATGSVLIGPVNIAGPASPASDGFTVLPNGNFLINNDDADCTYNQYNPTTGALIAGTQLVVPGGPDFCTGVDTDGTSLFFATSTASADVPARSAAGSRRRPGPLSRRTDAGRRADAIETFSFTKTDLSGNFIAQTFVGPNLYEDISLIHASAAASVPTLSEWAQIVMVALFVTSSLWVLRRRRLA